MEAGRGYYVGKRNGRPENFFSQKITIWGIKTLFASVGRGGGRVGWGSGLARRWGRGRVGSARRGPDSQELKSGVQREKFRQSAVARCGWGRVSCEKRALGDFERGKGEGRVGRGSGLARRWGRGRVGWARRGFDSRELKSVVHGEKHDNVRLRDLGGVA